MAGVSGSLSDTQKPGIYNRLAVIGHVPTRSPACCRWQLGRQSVGHRLPTVAGALATSGKHACGDRAWHGGCRRDNERSEHSSCQCGHWQARKCQCAWDPYQIDPHRGQPSTSSKVMHCKPSYCSPVNITHVSTRAVIYRSLVEHAATTSAACVADKSTSMTCKEETM
jgi:hypothetical protein